MINNTISTRLVDDNLAEDKITSDLKQVVSEETFDVIKEKNFSSEQLFFFREFMKTDEWKNIDISIFNRAVRNENKTVLLNSFDSPNIIDRVIKRFITHIYLTTTKNKFYTSIEENFLKVFEEYGFLHFCCRNLLKSQAKIYLFDQHLPLKGKNINYDSDGKFRFYRGFDYWWRGYSPFNRLYLNKFTSLFEVLREIERDQRFSQHISCLSQYFNITEEILLSDYLVG